MIIKGSSRGDNKTDVERLARHLVARENESVVMLEGCDVPADLGLALSAMRATTLGTRSRRALYHSSLSLPADEAFGFDDPRWTEAVDTLQRHLGLDGHQRVLVGHQKKGRRHVHVVWCRAHPETLRIASDSHSYRKHEAASRELEQRWACSPVVGVHSRPEGTPRPVAAATHQDWQAQTRTGIQVADVAAALKSAWDSTTTGSEFAATVKQAGLHLAVGRRGTVVVDGVGTLHSIPRRLGLRAADVHRRLADLDTAILPTVGELKARQQQSRSQGDDDMRKQYGASPRRAKRREQGTWTPLPPDYWRGLGFNVREMLDCVQVRLSLTCNLVDRGDRVVLHRGDGPPSDEEIRILVAACKAHMERPGGWEGVRFFGGTPQFQRRAREEAIRQGIPAEAISLECEDMPSPLAAASMPDHIRRRLQPDPVPESTPPIGDAPQPITPPPLEIQP